MDSLQIDQVLRKDGIWVLSSASRVFVQESNNSEVFH